MSLTARNTRIFQLLIVFIFVTITFYYLFLENRYNVHDVYRATVTGKKQSFIEDFLATEIDGPFNGSLLADLCNTKIWIPGLIFKCEPPLTGVANVRNVFLNCVRYAIEAGATGFIVPEIMVRRPKLTSLNELHAQCILPFAYLFDQDHFTNTLNASCPQLHIYSHQNDLWDLPTTANPVRLQRTQLTSRFHTQAETVMLSPANWTNAFKDHLNTSHPTAFSSSKPVLVSLHNPLLQWPIDYDEPAFIATFGRILRFNENLRRLAATVMYAMIEKYQLRIDPLVPGIHDGGFYGAHLRTAIDAVKAEWTPYEVQSENYISHAAESQLSLIYAAADSPPDLLRFIDQARNHTFSIEVTTKDTLLAGGGFAKEMAEMAGLTLDQQIAVDYEVLLRASKVGGTWESSFGWNLAMRRHVVLRGGPWVRLEMGPVIEASTGWYPSSKQSGTATKASNPTISNSTVGSQRHAAKPTSTADSASELTAVSPGRERPTQVSSESGFEKLKESARQAKEEITETTSTVPPRRHKPTQVPSEVKISDTEEEPSQPEERQANSKSKVSPEKSRPSKISSKVDLGDAEDLVPAQDEDENKASEPPSSKSPDSQVTSVPSKANDDDGKHLKDAPSPIQNNQSASSTHIPSKRTHKHRRTTDPAEQQAPSIPSQAFKDAYSTIFGDVLPGDHPGVVFQLTLWP